MRTVRSNVEIVLPILGLVLIFLNVNQAEASDSTSLTLLTKSCLITGEDNGIVKSSAGENVIMRCKIQNKKMTCQTGSSTTEYNLEVDIDSLFLAKSKSGNVFILGDKSTKRFSTAMGLLVADKGALMTKHCTGKIE